RIAARRESRQCHAGADANEQARHRCARTRARSVIDSLSMPSQEETIMAQVKKIPDGSHSVTPHLICAGAADAIEFYKKVFDAVEVMRIPGTKGRLMHACVRIGDSNVMLV